MGRHRRPCSDAIPPMNAIHHLFNPLRDAVAAIFKRDLALRRASDGVRIVLEERSLSSTRKARPPSRAETAERKESQELALIRKELAALLDDQPEARQTLRHLGFVEQALAKKGLRALHKLPLDVLQRALEQFEGLVVNWSPLGLANLRSKMAVAVIDREHMDPEAEADAYRTAAVLDSAPEPAAPAPEERSDDEALAAAYAALGDLAPSSGVEVQGELGSPVARAIEREAARPLERASSPREEIKLRELQS